MMYLCIYPFKIGIQGVVARCLSNPHQMLNLVKLDPIHLASRRPGQDASDASGLTVSEWLLYRTV